MEYVLIYDILWLFSGANQENLAVVGNQSPQWRPSQHRESIKLHTERRDSNPGP